MNPPYSLTPKILKLITIISEKIGEVNANLLNRPSPQLRKQNKIKTIHNSLKIEGNTLTEQQITALIDNKRIIGPKKDIIEVLNTIEVYDDLRKFNPQSERDFLKAHKTLMQGLIDNPGKYRKQGVGIVKGSNVEHIAPSYNNVPYLIKDLFKYLKDKNELSLIKSCVFHYEMEFIHPFIDGNGRMGRLWQTLILKNKYPVFEFIPLETLISKTQKKYYKALSESDRKGNSTLFIEYMLTIISNSLDEILNIRNRKQTQRDRLNYFIDPIAIGFKKNDFTRKDYMNIFKNISSATASRDLNKGVEINLLIKTGEKNKTKYRVK